MEKQITTFISNAAGVIPAIFDKCTKLSCSPVYF